MTERLYYTDSHLTDFTARILHVEPLTETRIAVRLDRTAFYPVGGGQPHDTGTLDAHTIIECTSDDGDDTITHIVELTRDAAPLAVGAEITGQVNWSRRFDLMQQHTAQHILSRAFLNLHDAPTGGFRITPTYSEVDIKLADPTDERIHAALALANKIVWENRAIKIDFMSPGQAAARGIRGRFERAGTLRIVEIDDYDFNPCGGTHTRATGAVGMIFITATEAAKGMTRLTFVAGARALDDYTKADHTARAVAALFSVSRDDAHAAARRLADEHKTLQRRARELTELAADAEAAKLVNETAPRADSTRVITRIFTDRDAAALRTLAQAIAKHTQTVALLACTEGETARLVFARSTDAHADMNQLLREACARLGGRGGGTPEFAQGGAPFTAQLQTTLDEFAARL
jgi:alanyl-tRNA synthetase